MQYIVIIQGSDLSPDIIRAGGHWFLHCSQAQNLKEVILHDISDNPELVEVAPSSLSSKGLLECDGDAGNVVSAPGGSKDHVSKS